MIEQCKQAQDYLEALRETAHMLSGVLNEPEILEVLLRRIVKVLAADKALVLLRTPAADQLTVGGAIGLSETYLRNPGTLSLDNEINRKVLEGEIIVSSDFDMLAAGYEKGLKEKLPRLVGVPLSVREHLIGALYVFVDASWIQAPETLVFLKSLTDLGALALERVRLQQSLYHIASALNSSLQLQTMLQEVLEATVREMWLKGASLRMLEPKERILRLVAAYGLSQKYMDKGEVHASRNTIDQRVLQGELVVIEDVRTSNGLEYPQAALQEGIRSMLVVPLQFKGRVFGVLRVYSASPRRFGVVARHFLKSVAHLISLAIENAELHGALQARYEDLKIDLAEWYRFLAIG
ncbi:MAG: GAF domain-containing protein [Desulfoferrobacter sp.]